MNGTLLCEEDIFQLFPTIHVRQPAELQGPFVPQTPPKSHSLKAKMDGGPHMARINAQFRLLKMFVNKDCSSSTPPELHRQTTNRV